MLCCIGWNELNCFLIPVLLTEVLQLGQSPCFRRKRISSVPSVSRIFCRAQTCKAAMSRYASRLCHARTSAREGPFCRQLVWILVSPFFPFKSVLSVLFLANHVPLLRHSWRKSLLPYLHISWTSWNPAKKWRYQKFSQSICCLVLWVNCTIAS